MRRLLPAISPVACDAEGRVGRVGNKEFIPFAVRVMAGSALEKTALVEMYRAGECGRVLELRVRGSQARSEVERDRVVVRKVSADEPRVARRKSCLASGKRNRRGAAKDAP